MFWKMIELISNEGVKEIVEVNIIINIGIILWVNVYL